MKKTGKRIISVLLALVMILSMTVAAFAETPAPGGSAEPADNGGTELEMQEIDPATLGIKKLGEKTDTVPNIPEDIDIKPDTSMEELVRVSIFLEKEGAAEAGYSVNGIATNKAAGNYRKALKAQQDSLTAQIEKTVGYSINVKWNFTLLTNAISAYVKVKDIPIIERMSGVKSVEREMLYQAETADPETYNTSQFMTGATAAWSAGYSGAGSKIAIIDTGIDVDHQAFDPEAFEYSLEQLDIDQEVLEEELLTKDYVDALVDNEYLYGSGVYINSKIPYAYNYVDQNSTYLGHDSADDKNGNHGSHVAGIAAANRYIKKDNGFVEAMDETYAVGMAPDAQLLLMKVFGEGGGAYDSDYFAALVDALMLGCDAANLSLGSGAPGFTYSVSYQSILNALPSYGMVVAISAGNAGAFTDKTYTDLYIDDVSMHTGGSPGTYVNSLGVAAAQNVGTTGTPLVFKTRNIFYTETSTKNGASMVSTAGTHDFVYIDGIGDEDEYAAVDSAVSLKDKIIIVNRGDISFYVKGNNAIEYDPTAVIVANNESGTISMALDDYTGTFPMVSITLDDAKYIKANSTSADASGITYYTGTITVSEEAVTEHNNEREDSQVTSFSSWGVPGSLVMKPEITAPGGDIYSVFGTTSVSTESGGTDVYGSYSGTSMAAPHIAGLAAVAAQYIRENEIEVGEYTSRAVIQSLLMSTATPMFDEGEYVSILQQGAGLVDVDKAVSSPSVIMVGTNDNDNTLTVGTGAAYDGKVKAEFGDDPEKTGVYEYSFTIYNITDEDLTFTVKTDLFTQDWYEDDYFGGIHMSPTTTTLKAVENYFWGAAEGHDVDQDEDTDIDDAQALLDYITGKVDGSELDLEAGEMDGKAGISSYDAYLLTQALNADDGVVPANSSRDIRVRLSLTEAQKAALDEVYTSGAYVEGFTYVTCKTATGEGVDLSHEHSIPLLGFYGSWTDPSMFDNLSLTDYLYGSENIPYSLDYSNYFTLKYNGVTNYFLGNPYYIEDEFPADKLAVNSNSKFVNVYYTLLRSAGTTGFAVSEIDEIGGSVTQVVDSTLVGNIVTGMYYSQSSGAWENTAAKAYGINKSAANYGFTKEGDIFRIGFYAVPEYTAMAASGDLSSKYAGLLLDEEDLNYVIESGLLGKGAYVGFDFTVDDTAPIIRSAKLNGTTLTIKATDNINLAYLAVLSIDGDEYYFESAPGTDAADISLDISDIIDYADGYVAVVAADYAGNEKAMSVKVNDDTQGANPNEVVSVSVRPKTLDIYKGNVEEVIADVLHITAVDRSVTWTTSDPKVATVDEEGKVTAVGAGTATITATSNSNPEFSDTCEVKVTSINKNFNGIVWDEEGWEYFANFSVKDEEALLSWTKLIEDPYSLGLLHTMMYSDSGLYAATLDASAGTSFVYDVDKSTFELEDIAQNYTWMTGMAPAATDDYGLDGYVGFAYTYAYMVFGAPISIGEDEVFGDPWAGANFGQITDGAYFAGIACKERALDGGTFYLLDENGIIWETTLGLNEAGTGFVFSTPSKVFETGIETSFLYQGLYFDGTYLYWTHYESGVDPVLYAIDPEAGMMYYVGSFGSNAMLVSGLYTDGAMAPASADVQEPMTIDETKIQKLAPADEEIMSEEIQARFKAEAAKMAVKSGSEPVPDGSLNKIKVTSSIRKPDKAEKVETETTISRDSSNMAVTISEDEEVSNGVATVTYDPEKLSFIGVTDVNGGVLLSANPAFAENADGTVTIKLAYAFTTDDTYGGDICVLEFAVPCFDSEVVVKTLERGADVAIENDVVTAPVEGLGHEWADPEWTWEGITAATATFVCEHDGEHTEELEATITSAAGTGDLDGTTVYTATVTLNGEEYTDFRILAIRFGTSISLDTQIALNAYIGQLPVGDLSEYTIKVFVDGEEVDAVDFSDLKAYQLTADGIKSDYYYLKIAELAAKNMTDEYVVKVFHNGNAVAQDTFSIHNYCQSRINDPKATAKNKKLCLATLTYGAEAQKHFKYKLDDLADRNIKAVELTDIPAEYAITGDPTLAGIDKVGTSGSFESQVFLNIYFVPKEGYGLDDFTFSVKLNGKVCDVTAAVLSNGYIHLKMPSVVAKDLGTNFEITATNKTTGTSATWYRSAMNYAYLTANGNGSATMKNLVKALYQYYLASK